MADKVFNGPDGCALSYPADAPAVALEAGKTKAATDVVVGDRLVSRLGFTMEVLSIVDA